MKHSSTGADLLNAARNLFAKHGFEGASVRQITAAAHTNLGAVTYHFGSKRKLYETVLEQAATPLADAAVAAAHVEGSPEVRVAAVVRAYFTYLADNPDVAQLMLQELVLGRTPPDAVVVPIRRIHGALMELVQDGQAQGHFSAGDPRLLAISIISQPVHMNLVRRALKTLANIDLQDESTRAHVIEHVTAFACAGLTGERSMRS